MTLNQAQEWYNAEVWACVKIDIFPWLLNSCGIYVLYASNISTCVNHMLENSWLSVKQSNVTTRPKPGSEMRKPMLPSISHQFLWIACKTPKLCMFSNSSERAESNIVPVSTWLKQKLMCVWVCPLVKWKTRVCVMMQVRGGNPQTGWWRFELYPLHYWLLEWVVTLTH